MTFDRRSLLFGTAIIATDAALIGCKDTSSSPSHPAAQPKPGRGPAAMSGPAFATIVAVAERLIPSEGDGPGAKEAGVERYLGKALDSVQLAHVVPMLKRAAGFLNRAARAEHNSPHFAKLTDAQKDGILQKLDAGRMRPRGFSGRQFLQVMMALTLEGYLGDPSHGGNRDRVAWEWLGFQQGGFRGGA